MKKYIIPFIALILMIIFVLIPLPASGLNVRMYMSEYVDGEAYLFYTSHKDPTISGSQIIAGEFDEANKTLMFKIPAKVADDICSFRIDWPEEEQTMVIYDVSVSSAGVTKHHYNPMTFFAEENIDSKNDIYAIDFIEDKGRAYIATAAEDPFISFSQYLLADMLQYRSVFRMTRLAICALIVAVYVSFKMNIFGADEEKEK